MGYMVQTLSIDLGVLLLYSFSPPSPLEKILLEPAIKEPLVSLAKLEAMVFVAIVLLCCSTLEPVASTLVVLLTFLPPFCFFSSFYLMQLLYHITAQLRYVALLTL